MNQFYFPEINSFLDLFVSPPRETKMPGSVERYICFGTERRGLYGYLKPEFEEFIQKSMMSICDDPHIFVDVCYQRNRDNKLTGEVLITFSYNKIIGNRWISIVPVSTIPE